MGCQAQQPGVLAGIAVQLARSVLAFGGSASRVMGVGAQRRVGGCVWGGRQMPQLHKNHGALGAVRGVARACRVAQVPALGVVVVALGKHTRQHQNFLTRRVLVVRKPRVGRVAHDAGSPPALRSHAVEHDAFHSRLG